MESSRATHELEPTYTRLDTEDAPSKRFGWHGEDRTAIRVVATFMGVFLCVMMLGNHRGNVENLWLGGIAIAIFLIVVRDIYVHRNKKWKVPTH